MTAAQRMRYLNRRQCRGLCGGSEGDLWGGAVCHAEGVHTESTGYMYRSESVGSQSVFLCECRSSNNLRRRCFGVDDI